MKNNRNTYNMQYFYRDQSRNSLEFNPSILRISGTADEAVLNKYTKKNHTSVTVDI
jgi:hypothetical protein